MSEAQWTEVARVAPWRVARRGTVVTVTGTLRGDRRPRALILALDEALALRDALAAALGASR